MQATPDLPAARAYVAHTRAAIVLRYNRTLPRRNGYALYFTVVSQGVRAAYLLKVCEDRHGHVTGSSNMSDGEPSC